MATTSDSDQQETARLTAALAASEARGKALDPNETVTGILNDLLDMPQDDPDHDDAIIVTYDHLVLVLDLWLLQGGIEPALAPAAAPGTGDRREPAIGPCPACLDRRTRGNGGDDRACMACGLRWSLSAPRGRR